jgi:gluconokinase
MATSFMLTAASRRASDGFRVVVMGVSGSGKTTVGKRLAEALAGEFLDGDDLHSDAARGKMHSGLPLTDEDRQPWLDRIGAALASALRARRTTVVACSALKRAYRDRLRAATGPSLKFVYLAAEPEAMLKRVGGRANHFMPASLVTSQFAALEPPRDEPDAIEVSSEMDLGAMIPLLVARLAVPAHEEGRRHD